MLFYRFYFGGYVAASLSLCGFIKSVMFILRLLDLKVILP